MKGKISSITTAGRITVATGIFTLLVISLLSTIGFVSNNADAKSATSTVKVLNTPPQYGGDAYELVASTQTNPSTFGTNITFVGGGYLCIGDATVCSTDVDKNWRP